MRFRTRVIIHVFHARIFTATQFAMNTWDDYLNDLMSEIKLCAMVSYPDGVLLASKGIGQFRVNANNDFLVSKTYLGQRTQGVCEHV